ncbi:MAG: hypothetical protein M3P45_06440 [Acidobacteriota bacterium]|nr:hypothetical protein [Acidobacteriota bacterium]
MSRLLPSLRSSYWSILRVLMIIMLVVTPAPAAYADLPLRLRNVFAAACYCHCHEALTGRGCTKMCDTKKRAMQWLATTCMKPRFQAPSDKSGAGPRFRRPDHAEHAELTH